MPSIINNIDRFNFSTLALLKLSYDAFPIPIKIDIAQVARSLSVVHSANYDDPVWIQCCDEASKWLQYEGFLRFEQLIGHNSPSGTIFNVQLTLKGLTLLGLPVSVSQNSKPLSLIDKCKSILLQGAEKAGTEEAKQLISEMLTMAIRFTGRALS